ncbi:MAG: L,D-transpeptidase [Pseudolabrys sp.]|nr:L,D-transpeptidase [Pseudolabrys sp.]MBV9260950.1 L,D-transpeptidase [Pseudolabrys sp.]
MTQFASRTLAVLAALSAIALAGSAHAQQFATLAQPAYAVQTPQDDDAAADEQTRPDLKRTIVNYRTSEAPGTIVIDTPNTYLYYVLGNGKAIRYGIGVGREGFTWAGVKQVARKAEWPDWYPPAAMVARQPYLPRMTAGGPGNPLGARAMYLGGTEYRIHGTNNPATIGHQVSSGCIRLTNEDVIDLYNRVNVGTKVVVLPQGPRRPAEPTTAYAPPAPSQAQQTWQTIRPAGVY